MKAPVSWLAEYVDLPAEITPRGLADALVRIGMEVEGVESGADALSGPIVVGRVLSFVDESQKNGKTIRWCQVDVGVHNADGEPRGIVCGAHNFAPDDLVVVSLPGAVLPGGFAISARKTYGHVSDGMICSVRELGIGEDHDGILVLPAASAQPGDDPLPLLGLTDAVLDVAVTTDRGYTMSIRGLAREAAAALGVPFRDVTLPLPAPDGGAYDVHVDETDVCRRFSARAVTGLDPAAPSPDWMVTRLRQCGIRSISLAVDVTNYVMLETGQPLHAFDRDRLSGPVGVRRAEAGERLTTLDDVVRTLAAEDVVVTDESGPIALAGVMGGASTEIGATSSAVVLEAATWIPEVVARTVRRHRLPSEAARRFERGVDPEIAGTALERCVRLLVAHGGATPVDGYTVVGEVAPPARIAMDAHRPERTAGMPIPRDAVVSHLDAVGCTVTDDGDVLQVQPPSWRPDLLVPADLVEEVVRLAGYDRLPSVLPAAPAGRGLTGRQRLHRAVSRAAAAAGYTEVLAYPFVAPSVHDAFGLAGDDPRRSAVRLANPLSDDEPELRTSLLPGLLGVVARNLGRGTRDLAVFETGLVFLPRPAGEPPTLPGIAARPSDAEIAALDAVLPDQPRHVAAVLTGNAQPRGWWGPERAADWADAVEFARVVARAARVELGVRATEHAPWHPGRCAELVLDDVTIGHAGELHPRVVAALGLPERTCAVELDLDALAEPGPPAAPEISGYPPVLLDVALVVGDDVAAAALRDTIREAAGPLLESVRPFAVYTDAERLGAGLRSVTFALRFRAPDRTLTVEEATAARDAAVTAAVERHGARLR
ncbi:phenylalanyl-tRNA synthetase beta subunit [Jatrophihabitans endophyticus]|uniref:Phenylalanine--tRNA ligase beta subunit n=1 Tax=Jatrophihabitans endophyticus TaxID=1206085 RepID=A0A1M5MMR1_9ACTN|nr:phenylalanine--tRNA ligase subunit beta [Jatrophihabitans endophyticus]SHG78209.1 phenylalanyl-tRNA synthetase beta subunit [Jatrophihabitans endophyticus]